MNERRLEKHVEALKLGDGSAFDYIYDNTYKAVFFTAYRIVGDRHIAEDVTQECYVTAVNKLDMYCTGTNFTGWLLTICKRLAINEYNREKGKSFSVDFSENESLYGEYYVEDNAEKTTIETAKSILTESEYQIVMMCIVAGYKRREVADILEIPIGTVTWKYNEALKKIRKKLEADNEKY